MSDLAIGMVAFSSMTSAVAWARAFTVWRRCAARASVAKNAQEYAMLEKMSERPRKIHKKKRSKTPPSIPFGL